MDDYGVISPFDIMSLWGLSFLVCWVVGKTVKNQNWFVFSCGIFFVVLIFSAYLAVKTDVYIGDKLSTPEQKQKLYLCLEDYRKQNRAAQVDSSIINDAVYFCAQKKRIDEEKRQIESWK